MKSKIFGPPIFGTQYADLTSFSFKRASAKSRVIYRANLNGVIGL